MRVALVVMPFASAERPSLAAGLLKAGLEHVGIACEVKYFNLTFSHLLGPSDYDAFAVRGATTVLGGEWVFSQCFYRQ